MFSAYYEDHPKDFSDYDDLERDVHEQRHFRDKAMQQIFLDEEYVDDTTCNMLSSKDYVILRRPTQEEIDEITANVVAQVQTRNMAHGADANKASGMFMKKPDLKKPEVVSTTDTSEKKFKPVNKKWEPKNNDNARVRKNNASNVEQKSSIPAYVPNKQKVSNAATVSDKLKETKGMSIDVPIGSSIDMIYILS